MDPAASAILLGFVLGLQHATDPDHLVAVATIVTREPRFSNGALVGVLWGLGHMSTFMTAGALIVTFRPVPAPGLVTGLELLVAAMLVGLGAVRLRDATRGMGTATRERLRADHDHGRAEVLHRHPHPHVHPSRRLLAALARGGRGLAVRAALIGAVHGMAGSAAVALLVLATLHTTAGALGYLVVFGLGTIAGMTALTAAMAYPVSLALRLGRARRLLALGAGAGSIAFGLVYAVRVL